ISPLTNNSPAASRTLKGWGKNEKARLNPRKKTNASARTRNWNVQTRFFSLRTPPPHPRRLAGQESQIQHFGQIQRLLDGPGVHRFLEGALEIFHLRRAGFVVALRQVAVGEARRFERDLQFFGPDRGGFLRFVRYELHGLGPGAEKIADELGILVDHLLHGGHHRLLVVVDVFGGVDDDPGFVLHDETVDRGRNVPAGVHHLVLHRRPAVPRRSDANQLHVLLQPLLPQDGLDHRVRDAPGRAEAYFLALEIRDRLDGGTGLDDPDHPGHRRPGAGDDLQAFPLRGRDQHRGRRRSGAEIHRAGGDGPHHFPAAPEIGDVELLSRFLEEPHLHPDEQRQVVQHHLAGRGDFDGPRLAPARARSERKDHQARQNGNDPSCCHGYLLLVHPHFNLCSRVRDGTLRFLIDIIFYRSAYEPTTSSGGIRRGAL